MVDERSASTQSWFQKRVCSQCCSYNSIVYVEAQADVDWHKPVVTWQSTVSDYLRGHREIEEPQLSLALLGRTPHAMRWPMSVPLLTWVVSNSGDPVEVQRCEECLRRLVPNKPLPPRRPDTASVQPGDEAAARGKGYLRGHRAKGKGKGGKSKGKGS